MASASPSPFTSRHATHLTRAQLSCASAETGGSDEGEAVLCRSVAKNGIQCRQVNPVFICGEIGDQIGAAPCWPGLAKAGIDETVAALAAGQRVAPGLAAQAVIARIPCQTVGT